MERDWLLQWARCGRRCPCLPSDSFCVPQERSGKCTSRQTAATSPTCHEGECHKAAHCLLLYEDWSRSRMTGNVQKQDDVQSIHSREIGYPGHRQVYRASRPSRTRGTSAKGCRAVQAITALSPIIQSLHAILLNMFYMPHGAKLASASCDIYRSYRSYMM